MKINLFALIIIFICIEPEVGQSQENDCGLSVRFKKASSIDASLIRMELKIYNNGKKTTHINQYTWGLNFCRNNKLCTMIGGSSPYSPSEDSTKCSNDIFAINPGDSIAILIDSVDVSGTSCINIRNAYICELYLSLFLCTYIEYNNFKRIEKNQCNIKLKCSVNPFLNRP